MAARRKPSGTQGETAVFSDALGIDRLRPLLPTSHGRAKAWITTLVGRDTATRRNAVKFTILLVTFLLGFSGFQQTVKPTDDPLAARTIWNNLFSTLQLLTTQFPRDLSNSDLPWQLQVARFFMPLFAAWFTLSALMRRFNRPLLAWFAGRTLKHVVLVGGSDIHQALTRAYRRRRWPVVAVIPPVTADVVLPIEEAGARVVFGEATDPRTLRRAGIHRAAVLIAADDVGAAAIRLSSAVAQVSKRLRSPAKPPLLFLMRLAQREMRDLVASQATSSLHESNVSLRLYVRERTIARALLSRYPADWGLPPGPHDIHAVIVGFGEMGGELLLQLARIAVPSSGRGTTLTVIDRDVDGLKERMLAAYPGLAHCARLRFISADLRPNAIKAADIEAWMLDPSPATALYVCCGDDHANMAMAMGLRRAYAQAGAASPPMFVDQHLNADQVDALAHIHGRGFDTLRVMPFGSIAEEADPLHLVDEDIDELARRLHGIYLAGLERAATTGGGRERVRAPAEAPWAELDETYRAANRSQADHILMKLRGLGLHAVIGADPEQREIDAARLESLAMQEHERWCRDRWLAGWSLAESRDNQLRHHPDLRPYEQLDEAARDKDRQSIRGLPAVLAELDIGLKRDRRVGIWFDDEQMAPTEALVGVVERRLTDMTKENGGVHLQLVLPLRSSGEFDLATSLASRHRVGIDVALMRSGGSTEIGWTVDREAVRSMIAVSDRAFHVGLPEESKLAGAAGRLSALCDICETVVLACEEAEAAATLLEKIDAPRRGRVEVISRSGGQA